jgi:transglutaminase-like putative cysteine protease
MKTKNQIFFACFLLLQCISSYSFSQNIEEVDQIRNQYPDAKAIFLSKTEECRIFIENNTVKGTNTVHEKIVINNETGIGFQNGSVYTSSFVEVSEIKAFSQIPNGKKYIKKEVEKMELKDNPNRNVFYDDDKIYKFKYPSAQTGTILNLDYQQTYNELRFLGNYFWASYIPTVYDEFKISVQKNINIQYKLFNAEGFNVEFTKEDKKDAVIYTWKVRNNKPVAYYDDAPNFRYYVPHLIFYITDYEIAGEKKKLLGSPKELLDWYEEIQKNVNKTEDKRLRHITDSLLIGITEDHEKVKKIFYWVQDNISYVAFEDGLGGYVPRDAGVVCNRKYGDCKDMASVINEMLRIAGVKSYLTRIGSRDIPYTYTDLPTPENDNHMITSYLDKQGRWMFLDATGKSASIDLFTSFIQGKQAFITISPDSFLLVTVPVKDTSVNQTIDSMYINLDGNIVKGKGKVLLTGYDGLDYFYYTENRNKEEQLEFFKEYFSKGSNKASFKDVVMKLDKREPVSITYNFDLPDYAVLNQNELYINMNIDKGFTLDKITDDRKVAISIKHKTRKKFITVLNIPDGYKVEYMPQNARLENDVIGFSGIYQFINNQIIFTSNFYVNTLLVQASDFEKYNSVITERIKACNQTVSLIKK